MNEPLLKATGVNKTFRRAGSVALEVLRSVDFSIEASDRIAILGQSGAGKSTLLHILGTLESPSSGKVLFEGEDIFAFEEAKLSLFRNQKLGFVFQFHYLMLEFSALENVMMPALLSGKTKAQSRGRAKELLDLVGLSERLEHKPSQLSGGEQQRVAIARALMNQPKLLLTDEMTGNLDPATGRQVFDLVQSLHSQFSMAMVSVTHDEKLAQHYPKIFRLVDGKVMSS